MIKAAFFDVDGTLLSHNSKSIPDSAKKALQVMREKGIQLFLATGRGKSEINRLPVKDLTFDGYVTLNGQICLDSEKKLSYGIPLQGKSLENVLDIFCKKETPFILVEEERLYINFINDEVVEAQKDISTPLPQIREYEGDPVYMAIGFFTEDQTEAWEKKLPDCTITRWNPKGVDIIAKGGSKAAGVARIAGMHGWDASEIIAFGDGENDIEMMQYAGIGVAMGNAEASVKAIADYVTTDIDQDGIWNAAKQYGLL